MMKAPKANALLYDQYFRWKSLIEFKVKEHLLSLQQIPGWNSKEMLLSFFFYKSRFNILQYKQHFQTKSKQASLPRSFLSSITRHTKSILSFRAIIMQDICFDYSQVRYDAHTYP